MTGRVTIFLQTFEIDQDVPLTEANPARIVFDNSGPEDNTTLTGVMPLPAVETPPYVTCPNPSIPVNGSFHRGTGLLVLRGSLSGASTFHFGVQETDLGTFRVQVRINNLAFQHTGRGVILPDGTLRFQHSGRTPLTFTGTPRLGLKSPAAPDPCVFGGTQASINNASFALQDWTAYLPGIRGAVRFADCPGVTGLPLTLQFHPVDGGDRFVRQVIPEPDGSFFVPNLPAARFLVRASGPGTLARVIPVSTASGHAMGVDLGDLLSGDANGDNSVDVLDLAELIASFDSTPSSPGWNDGRADFNRDDSIDVLDLDVLIRNFDRAGEELP
ncbi:MAG: dockerin type I domain-containing protein [Chloroherpetonaceae bacterium]|nr:dockerin type I domain-containing protein [Chloroherpetonaceae bacterium]